MRCPDWLRFTTCLTHASHTFLCNVDAKPLWIGCPEHYIIRCITSPEQQWLVMNSSWRDEVSDYIHWVQLRWHTTLGSFMVLRPQPFVKPLLHSCGCQLTSFILVGYETSTARECWAETKISENAWMFWICRCQPILWRGTNRKFWTPPALLLETCATMMWVQMADEKIFIPPFTSGVHGWCPETRSYSCKDGWTPAMIYCSTNLVWWLFVFTEHCSAFQASSVHALVQGSTYTECVLGFLTAVIHVV